MCLGLPQKTLNCSQKKRRLFNKWIVSALLEHDKLRLRRVRLEFQC